MTPLHRATAFLRHASARPMSYVVLFGIVAIVVVCAISALSVYRLRDHEIAQAERNLKTVDLLLGEETERAIQNVDLILRSLQDKIASDGVATPDDLAATQAGTETHALLMSRFAGIPQIAALVIVDQRGDVVATSRHSPAPRLNIADRDQFKVLKDAPPNALFLSEPRRNQADQSWTSYLARRINDPAGHFLGLVECAVNLDYFEQLYKSLNVGQGGAVSLWRSNGVLMARFPPLPNKIGHAFPIRSFSGILRDDGPVTYQVAESIDGMSRVVSTVKAKQFPLVINVTETFDQILADWRRTATMIGLGCLFCVLTVLLVMWLLARQFRAFAALSVAQAERGQAVAARDHAEEQLRQAQKLDALGQLTGGVAHDFNNLLTGVLGNLELLQRHGRNQEARFQRWVQNALEAAQRGAVLTQRLLAFSRRQPLSPSATDVARLVQSLSDLLERTLGENIKMEIRLAADLRRADVDPNQLDNAILNVAINARDAMDGRGTLTIEARNARFVPHADGPEPSGETVDGVLIAITDTGRGIPQAVLDHVFEPFFTTKPIGQGTGLGLSQVYGFVKQTGGHIEIKSEVGTGTCISIYLPLAEVQVESARQAAPDDRKRVQPTMRVLVVEDDAAVLNYSLETLRELGFDPVAARDASEALAIMRAGIRFDLLFTDIGLPGLNGHELAQEAKRLQPGLRVLFVSGYTRDVIMHKGRLERGVQLLSKPFTRADLEAKLDQVLVHEAAPRAIAG